MSRSTGGKRRRRKRAKASAKLKKRLVAELTCKLRGEPRYVAEDWQFNLKPYYTQIAVEKIDLQVHSGSFPAFSAANGTK